MKNAPPLLDGVLSDLAIVPISNDAEGNKRRDIHSGGLAMGLPYQYKPMVPAKTELLCQLR